jgi:hypothetical protein
VIKNVCIIAFRTAFATLTCGLCREI